MNRNVKNNNGKARGSRNFVNEILSKKQRSLPTSKRWESASERLNHLSAISNVAHFIQHIDELEYVEELGGFDYIEEDYNTIKSNTGLHVELLRYIPIGLVACMEGYFRQVYADLINHGSPYKENACNFSTIQFSIETAISLELHSVSIGDFVAHLLKTNNLDDINHNITTLIGNDGGDFLKNMKTIRNQAIGQQYLFPVDENELMGYTISGVRRIFELRNIFFHESDPAISTDEISSWTSEDSDRISLGFRVSCKWFTVKFI